MRALGGTGRGRGVALSVSSDTHWRHWGRTDPYFGVLTDERFSRRNIQSNRVEFFRSGETFVDQLLVDFERSFGPLPRGRALDFGCGVGRLSLPLARRFGEVVALDISEDMLAEAERTAGSEGLSNVGWRLSDDRLSGADGQFDFVNTYIVLQHIPTARGMGIIRRLLERVRPGGGAFIHFSIARRGSRARAALYWARHRLPGVNGLVNLALGQPFGRASMQMNEYPLAEIVRLHLQLGFPTALSRFEDHGGALTVGLLSRRDG